MKRDGSGGTETASVDGLKSTAFRGRRKLRGFALVVVSVSAMVAIACGGSDEGSNAGSVSGEDSTATTAATVLTPIGASPLINVVTSTDGTFDLDRLENQPVLLNFWFPSCPPCRAELPDLQAAHLVHGDDIQFLGVQLLGLDSAEEADEFLAGLGVTYPSGPDAESKMVRDFKIVGFPTTVFLNSDHDIVKKHSGILSAHDIESLINATIASGGQTVTSDS
ncbi:MAG: TlpA disulfide reductase family protein [Chloroflexi bacterium]|nr:TlpA disulfide reductase family protein [Chloroflexota bacterium]